MCKEELASSEVVLNYFVLDNTVVYYFLIQSNEV